MYELGHILDSKREREWGKKSKKWRGRKEQRETERGYDIPEGL